MSQVYVNSCYSNHMDKFYAVYLSVIIVGKRTCMIPRDLHHTPSMAAYKMIRLKFELACKSSIAYCSFYSEYNYRFTGTFYIVNYNIIVVFKAVQRSSE